MARVEVIFRQKSILPLLQKTEKKRDKKVCSEEFKVPGKNPRMYDLGRDFGFVPIKEVDGCVVLGTLNTRDIRITDNRNGALKTDQLYMLSQEGDSVTYINTRVRRVITISFLGSFEAEG